MRILLEASTESEWVAQHLETLGHEVIVADPNYAPMYGHRSRRIKTDRRDVAALAEACQHGMYRVGASAIGAAAGRCSAQLECSSRIDGGTDAGDLRWRGRSLAAAGFGSGVAAPTRFSRGVAALELPASMTDTLVAAAQRDRARLNDELAKADETVCHPRCRGPRRPPPDDAAGHRSDHRQRVCRRAG